MASASRIFLAISLLASLGCARINVPPGNVVMFDENGKLLDPTGNIGCSDPPALCDGRHFGMIPYRELDEGQRAPYVRNVMDSLLRDAPKVSDRRRLLIFVHGGLNTQKGTVERAADLTPQIRDGGYYPLFVNWRSSLVSSYFDHAFFIRQGETHPIIGPLTSPVVIAVDVGRSFVRAPLVWGAQIAGGLKTLPNAGLPYDLDGRDLYLKSAYQQSLATGNEGHTGTISVETGSDGRTWPDEALSGTSWFLLSPVRLLVAAPLIDGLGTSAWDNMLRRTQMLFHSPGEYKGGHPGEGQGDLTMVMRRLQAEIKNSGEKWEIVLFGHSMGSIVLNEVIREFPDMEYSRIVYMAAACSVKDFEESVIPYLRKHPSTQFYSLSLHHVAEERERWEPLIPYVDPAMRGSLLAWIDDFLANPLTPMDKTLGKHVNVVRTEQVIPPDLRGRVHLKEFSVGGDSVGKEPQKHGDFGEFRFWEESFYTPRPHRE